MDFEPTGRFVVVVGIDGAGKTSAVENLRDRLEAAGQATALFRSRPYFAWWANERLHDSDRSWSIDSLFLALTIETLKELIWEAVPMLASYPVVLADRHPLCMVAKGIRAGISPKASAELRDLLSIAPRPSVVAWLDLHPEIAANRLVARGDQTVDLSGLKALRAAYGHVLRDFPTHRIDSAESAATIVEQLYQLALPGTEVGTSDLKPSYAGCHHPVIPQ